MLLAATLVTTPPTVQIFTTLQSYYVFLAFSIGIFVIGLIAFLVFKNRARPGRQVPAFAEDKSEWGNWKLILLLLILAGAVDGFVEYETFTSEKLVALPSHYNMTIGVTGRQFAWSFTYPNGYTDYQNLTVPQNQVIILNITSADVTHGFFIPSLDVGKDAQPGIYNQVWINATQLGTFTIACRQLCGVGHALMLSKLVVVSDSQYNAWYAKLPAPSAKGGA